jgi:hypothetical protein
MFMSARVALFDPSNSSITISAISAEPPARTDARQLPQDPYALLVVPVVQNHFQQVQVGSGTVSKKSRASTVNRSDSPRFVASRRAPSTVREIKCLAVRRGVGLHQSQNEVAVGSADIGHSPAITYRKLLIYSGISCPFRRASGARRDVGFLTSSQDDGGQVCLTKRFNSSDPV